MNAHVVEMHAAGDRIPPVDHVQPDHIHGHLHPERKDTAPTKCYLALDRPVTMFVRFIPYWIPSEQVKRALLCGKALAARRFLVFCHNIFFDILQGDLVDPLEALHEVVQIPVGIWVVCRPSHHSLIGGAYLSGDGLQVLETKRRICHHRGVDIEKDGGGP